jgi:CheY-like chemotaxis protein
MNRSMKILVVEHDLYDIDLLRYELSRAFPNHITEVVQTEADFCKALESRPDIILSDYSLPSFDGTRAFEIKKTTGARYTLHFSIGYHRRGECSRAY